VTEPIRVALAPTRLGANPYLDDLARALPPERIVEVKAGWDALSGRAAGRPADIVHIQFIQMLMDEMGARTDPRRASARYLRRLARLRKKGVAVAWTMHNRVSHESTSPHYDRMVRRATALVAKRVFVHCRAAAVEVRRLWPLARVSVMSHPAHDRVPTDRAAARAALDIPADARVVAIPGRIRGYKDVPGAVRALRDAADDRTLILVAGAPHEPRLGDEVKAATGDDPRVRLTLRLLDDDEMDRIVAASDVALAPYRWILTSGMVALTSEQGVPTVAPATGCLEEQLGEGGLFYAPGDLRSAAALAIKTPIEELRRRGAQARTHVLSPSWGQVGIAYADAYEQILGRRGGYR
jgi:beta-1,4-mannosyltransferase